MPARRATRSCSRRWCERRSTGVRSSRPRAGGGEGHVARCGSRQQCARRCCFARAGRTDQAVDACLRAADEAERAVAFTEAAELLERVLPHVSDRRERALLLCRMGVLRWLNGEPASAEQLLADGVTQLDELGVAVE